jgi:hypothetical protein
MFDDACWKCAAIPKYEYVLQPNAMLVLLSMMGLAEE